MDTPQGVAGNLKQAGPSIMKATSPPCGFSADTEILTHDGWMRFSQLTYMSEVATRSPEGMFEWQYPEKITCQPYEGDMVEFRSKAVDLMVTPDSPMLVRRRKLKRQKESGTHTRGHDWHFRHADYFVAFPGAVFEVPAVSQWAGVPAPAQFVIPGRESDRCHPAHEEAARWLATFLVQPWTPSSEVVAAAKAAGIAHNAFQAARANLGLRKRRRGSTRNGKGISWWETSAPTRDYPPQSGPYVPRQEVRIPAKAFCALLGLFLAEGWTGHGDREILIAQLPTSRHLPEIKAILDATGLHWSYDEKNAKFLISCLPLGEWLREKCGHLARNKRIPDRVKEWPPEYLEVLLRGMMIGDGHWGPVDQRYYTTTSPGLADDVQEVFQKTGHDAWIRPQDLNKYPTDLFDGRRRGSYVVRERLQETHLLPRCIVRKYRGDIWRVAVPNATAYIRRNGRAVWASGGGAVV